ncbi:arylsulfatase [Amycolatopsis sp. GM8]|uniref:arylsulfatase n=1 Tax=Amycolatopsis sp. GM8 TaxID=2896530 RepID=UPI001F2183DD|nr:arylsulfatase [Amycolatopsis sp. GM8]
MPGSQPNVIIILFDDLGYGQFGCFGSDISTPNLDALAEGGARYNRFHVTGLCSPTRASLLTGRNHHRVGMGQLTESPQTSPGYSAHVPASAGTLAQVLRNNGYNTMAVGKWHLTPRWERSARGPFDRWPLGMGFERFYGFLGAETNHWAPDLVSDNGPVAPPKGPEEGYHLTEDLTDKAIRLIQDQQQTGTDKPFFMYYALGAMHAPHHAPREWIDRYRGQFDEGWDAWREKLAERQKELGIMPADAEPSPRPEWVTPWADMSPDEQRLCARSMEVYAGFLSHTDEQIGRLTRFLDELDILDDTLVFVMSDNGASPEGGLFGSNNYHQVAGNHERDEQETLERIDELGGFKSYNHYAWGWAWAGNTPFRLWKKFTWLGGTRTSLIAHWPNGIAEPGSVRDQFCHVIDVMPTVLDVAGVTAPAEINGVTQMDLDGTSFRESFAAREAPSARTSQYFEMVGSRAMYCDGWKVTTNHVGPTPPLENQLIPGSGSYDTDHWALFDLNEDFAETTDLSDKHPEIVTRLVNMWWTEAGRNNVLPLDDGWLFRRNRRQAPQLPPRRWVFRPGGSPVSEFVLPPLRFGFTLTATVTADEPASGILATFADWNQGWSWYVLDGRPVFVVKIFGRLYRFPAETVLSGGEHTLAVDYRPVKGSGGTVALNVDGKPSGEGQIAEDLPWFWQMGHPGLIVARDQGFPVCADYTPPFEFAGRVHTVVLEVPDGAAPSRPKAPAAGAFTQALRHE